MTLETSIKDCASGLLSDRLTDRKKVALNLKNFLAGNAAPALISENTNKRRGYTWSNLFTDIHEYVLKETEKYETSKTFHSVTAPLCESLLQLCVTKSIAGKAYIKCDRITEACLFILRDRRLFQAIGDAYLNILLKQILKCDYYIALITPSTWEDLLDISLSNILDNDVNRKLKLALNVVRSASKFCQFISPVRESLPKFKKIFHKFTYASLEKEVVLEIMIILLEMLSSENRTTMCEFTESVMKSLMKSYDQNVNTDKKIPLFKILHLTIALHHPLGKRQHEEGSLAHDWGLWNIQIFDILEIVCLEIINFQKKKQCEKYSKQFHLHFYNLAASVYYQIFHLIGTINQISEESSSKKPKVSLNKIKSFNDIIENLRQNHIPWIGIVHYYLKNYHQSMTLEEYTSLLSSLECLLSKSNSVVLDWDIFQDLTVVVIQHLNVLNGQQYGKSMLTMWNTCVRNSSATSLSQPATHVIMQLLISSYDIDYQHIYPLLKMYYEKSMPIAEYSTNTLSAIFSKYFSKCSYIDIRVKCLDWLLQDKCVTLDSACLQEIIYRLISSDRINPPSYETTEKFGSLYETLFNSTQECILFSDFLYKIPKEKISTSAQKLKQVDINVEIDNKINKYFCEKLSERNDEIRVTIEKCLNQSTNNFKSYQAIESLLVNYAKIITSALSYIDVLLHSLMTPFLIEQSDLFSVLKTAFKILYTSVTKVLKSYSLPDKYSLLRTLESILTTEYHSLLKNEVRASINQELIMAIHDTIHAEQSRNHSDDVNDCDDEVNPRETKHCGIYVLASYCKQESEYREQLLNLITDSSLYDFTSRWDTSCAFKCIKLLTDHFVQNPPFDIVFQLLQEMCKVLFRDPDGTYEILKNVLLILEKLWLSESNRQNCIVMVKSYSRRCDNLYYPPHVAALVYECVAKIVALNNKDNREIDEHFKELLIRNIKGSIHSIRLYCCYLIEHVVELFTDLEINTCFADFSDIFTINVSNATEEIIKDEMTNRAATLLHGFYTLANTKKSLTHKIVIQLVLIQKDKPFLQSKVKVVLNTLTLANTGRSIESYLNSNILSVIYYWFSKNYSLNNFPIHLFGFERMDAFLEAHLRWLTSADILWRKQGNVLDSEVLKLIESKFGKSEIEIIEMCFSSINSLCLPFIVIQKYKLQQKGLLEVNEFNKISVSAHKMFQLTRQILENEKWTDLFVESMGELVLSAAVHMKDSEDARRMFTLDLPDHYNLFVYPKEVYFAILKYFEELIENNMMQYLCSNQPLAIFKILLNLWDNVLTEEIFEYKALSVHTFVTFIQSLPLNYTSDAFVCNFSINSLSKAIKCSKNKEEIIILCKAMKALLSYFLPKKSDMLNKSVTNAFSVLLLKKEEGYETECAPLIDFFKETKYLIKESQDCVDFSIKLSQAERCSTNMEFLEKLRVFNDNIQCPSYEVLTNLYKYLKVNKSHIYKWHICDFTNTGSGLNVNHEVINKLTDILRSPCDEKMKIEASGCLSILGTYDLKALVTVSPKNSSKILNITPTQYFSFVVVSTLLENIYNETPTNSLQITKTLHHILKYKDGQHVLDAEEMNKNILEPLSSKKCAKYSEYKIDNNKFESLSSFSFLIPNLKEHYINWLQRVTCHLLDFFVQANNFIKNLRMVCSFQSNVCKHILPPLFGLVLSCLSEQQNLVIRRHVNQFFEHLYDMTFEQKIELSDNKDATDIIKKQNYKKIIQYILDVVDFVRIQSIHYRSRQKPGVETLNYLHLEYNKVAWAATIADQNLTAIYYSELWAMAANDGVPPSSPEKTSRMNGGADVQKIMRKCFVSIGEMYAIDGCGTAHLTSEEEMRKHLIYSGRFSDALTALDLSLRGTGPGARVGSDEGSSPVHQLQRGVMRALHGSQMYHLALQYIKSIPETDEYNDIKYDCLSSLGDWSYFVDSGEIYEKYKQSNINPETDIKALYYACLKDCMITQAAPDFQSKFITQMNRAKIVLSKLCQHINVENCQNLYKIVGYLHLFNDVEEYFSVRSNETSITELLNHWEVQSLPPHHDFNQLERLMSQRSLILEHAAKAYCDFADDIVALQLKYVELGLSNQRVQTSQRLLSTISKMKSSQEIALFESQISWAKGHKDIALSLLRKILESKSNNVRLQAISLRQYGLWMGESKFDNARDIINKYLMKSLEVMKKHDDMETRLKVYYDIAKFADDEYKQVMSYMSSSIFEDKLKCMESMKDIATNLKSQAVQKLSKDERKALLTNDRFSALDEEEIANTRAEKKRFLELAMRYYLLSLHQSEDNNLSVFRVISLWLDNPDVRLDGDGESFEELLQRIPSRKFVEALPQLAPRLTNDTDPFAKNLMRIIEKCAVEHPFHTLPILFSLKNSDKDALILSQSVGAGSAGGASGSGRGSQRPEEPRVATARALLARLNRHPALTTIVSQMDQLCDAIISIANFLPKSKESKQKIPLAEPIHRLRKLDAVPVPIVPIPTREDCNYSYVKTLVSFNDYFELVGGVNCPKKITCTNSYGEKKICMIKGEDDLRQDAVMQQIFTIVNTLLETNPVTNKNKLLIRTYKVVPMSRRSGVIEWCEGTIPLGAYLVGNSGAHAKYRPQDISCSAARTKLTVCYEAKKSNAEKLKTFLKILENLKPAFHYFFTEHYHDPVTWYERRLAYTKSVAASSMVGYILGLGDRHVQNILIDKKTAEVIHIDFGIAFDQGKTLPTPETIPFRLTQDMIAGFGCSGVEGIFRSCCEKTMQLLRDNHETLLTILQVLLCDPLYSWTITTAQQKLPSQKRTNAQSGNIGIAERALLAVRSKLSGADSGAGAVAVPGQVAHLIHSATDPANLSRLFPGWQPYL